jgi:hypothetical protein
MMCFFLVMVMVFLELGISKVGSGFIDFGKKFKIGNIELSNFLDK